jgi:hypothetical protein
MIYKIDGSFAHLRYQFARHEDIKNADIQA